MAMITVNKAIVQAAVMRYRQAVLEQRSKRLERRIKELQKPYRTWPFLFIKRQRSEAEAMFVVNTVTDEDWLETTMCESKLKKANTLMGLCNVCNQEDITLTEDEDWLLPYLSLRDRP